MINKYYYKLTGLMAGLVTADGIPKTNLSRGTVTTVLEYIFGLTGAIALLVIVIAGFRYTISRGDANNIKNSRDTIIYAVVGLIITMGAYAIVKYVFGEVRQ